MLLVVEAFQGKHNVTILVLAPNFVSHLNQVKLSWNCQYLCKSFLCKSNTGTFLHSPGKMGEKAKQLVYELDRNSGKQENITYFPYVQLWEITEGKSWLSTSISRQLSNPDSRSMLMVSWRKQYAHYSQHSGLLRN